MSDNAGDKPFAPTQHRLQESRKRGEVPTSADLPMVAAGLSAVATLWVLAQAGLASGASLMSSLMDLAFVSGHEARHGMAMRLTFDAVLWASALPLLAAAVAGTFVKRLITGPVFSAKAVTPDLNRVNPISGLKRLFSRDTWVALLKSVVGAAAVAGLLGAWLWHLLPGLLAPGDVRSILGLAWHHFLVLLLLGLLIHAIPSAFDFFYQRHAFFRRLRMDMKDLKDEHKQLEGQPEVKSERRQRHRELLQ